jgi:hypothetical protein
MTDGDGDRLWEDITRHYEDPERRRTLDAATILIAYGPDAAAEALHHAFVSELATDSIAAQFWIEVYRVILERRPPSNP